MSASKKSTVKPDFSAPSISKSIRSIISPVFSNSSSGSLSGLGGEAAQSVAFRPMAKNISGTFTQINCWVFDNCRMQPRYAAEKRCSFLGKLRWTFNRKPILPLTYRTKNFGRARTPTLIEELLLSVKARPSSRRDALMDGEAQILHCRTVSTGEQLAPPRNL